MGVITHHVYWRVIGNSVALAVHSCNSLAMFLAMRGDILKDPDINILKSNQFKFYTIWNVEHYKMAARFENLSLHSKAELKINKALRRLIFQILFLLMSLTCDIPILMKVKKEDKLIGALRKYNKIFYGGLVWPSSVLVFLIFWPMYLYDRELLFPAYIDKALSQWSNHVMHTAVLPIAIWTLIFQPRNKPKSHTWYYLHLGTIFVCYFTFLLYNHAVTGTWPYPLLKIIYGTIYFPILFILIVVVFLFLYYIQWSLTSFIHDTPKLKKK